MTTDYRSERIDLRKLWTQFIHRIWIVIAATIVGAIIGVLAYTFYAEAVGGNQMYELRNDYYIYLDYEGVPNGPDYYNAYTWDSILRDDPIVNYAIEIAPELTKEEILSSVSGEILGDYRILTVVVRGTNKELIQNISDAYKIALPHFAGVVEAIDHIDLWTDSDIKEYDEYTREGNAAFLGGLIAFLISLFAILIQVVLDDGIYTERDWINRYPDIPYLGRKGTEEYKANALSLLGSEEDYIFIRDDEFAFNIELFDRLKESKGAVIVLDAGKSSAELVDKMVNTFNKQGIKTAGVSF